MLTYSNPRLEAPMPAVLPPRTELPGQVWLLSLDGPGWSTVLGAFASRAGAEAAQAKELAALERSRDPADAATVPVLAAYVLRP